MKRKNRKNIKKLLILFFLLLVIDLVLYLAPKYIELKSIKEGIKSEVTIELGTEIDINTFLKEENLNAKIDTDLSNINKVGEYKIKININDKSFFSILKIKDTIAPEVEVQNLEIYLDEPLPKSTDFITKIDDLSDYKIQDYNLDKEIGTHLIEIKVIDSCGNETIKSAELTIKEDKEPPVFSGLTTLSLEVGSIVDLKKDVTAVDKRFGSVDFTVDDSKVNYQQPGNYKVIYKAKDNLNNEAIEERTVIIKSKDITYKINNFPTYNQYPNYPNGCESIALYNLLKYYNVNVTPEQIVERLKKGDGPYRTNGILYGGNPEVEFVGDPRAKNGYGVYQKPILDVANYYKSGMIDYTGHSLNEVLQLVRQNIPVQVWVSINLKDTKICATWTYKATGEKINWICNLHSVVVIGFNSNTVYVSDSYTGNIESYDRKQFEKMYNLFGKRSLYYAN